MISLRRVVRLASVSEHRRHRRECHQEVKLADIDDLFQYLERLDLRREGALEGLLRVSGEAAVLVHDGHEETSSDWMFQFTEEVLHALR